MSFATGLHKTEGKRHFRITTRRGVWMYTLGIALLSMVLSEACVLALYLAAGRNAFHIDNAIVFAGLVPLLIATPITYWTANMSRRLANAKAELQVQADTDPLTALPNRRSFFRAAEMVLEGHQHNLTPAALLVIDADHFKELNDSYGHAIGDKALVIIADILRENFRQSDLTCRVGGEEFAVLLPGMSMQDASTVANRVVEHVNASPLQESGAIIEFSVSCGVADTSVSYDLSVLFKAADDAMYVAKSQGRNRVVLRNVAA